jgi:hypothetical protein
VVIFFVCGRVAVRVTRHHWPLPLRMMRRSGSLQTTERLSNDGPEQTGKGPWMAGLSDEERRVLDGGVEELARRLNERPDNRAPW